MSILDRDKEKIQEKIDRIQNNTFNSDDLEILFGRLRTYIHNKNSKLLDLTHYTAHSRRENKKSHTIITATPTLEGLISHITMGSHFTVKHLFDRYETIEELETRLKELGLNIGFDLRSKEDVIMTALCSFLDNAQLEFKIPNIYNAVIKSSPQISNKQNLSLFFGISPPSNSLLRVPPNVTFAIPFFDQKI